MPKTKAVLKQELTRTIAGKLCEIEDLCHAYGLASLTLFTCICRDPDNPDMTVVVTNEQDPTIAYQWAQQHTMEAASHD